MTNKLKHVSGKKNVADVLSRPADPPLLNSIPPNSAGIDYLKMAEEQQSDLDLQNLKQNNKTSLLLKDVPLRETGATLLCDDSQGRLRDYLFQNLCVGQSSSIFIPAPIMGLNLELKVFAD